VRGCNDDIQVKYFTNLTGAAHLLLDYQAFTNQLLFQLFRMASAASKVLSCCSEKKTKQNPLHTISTGEAFNVICYKKKKDLCNIRTDTERKYS